VHECLGIAARGDHLAFEERRDDPFHASRDRAVALRPHQSANTPSTLEKTTRDVPPDKTGGARHCDDAAHAMAF
jgi:hypothetical protein